MKTTPIKAEAPEAPEETPQDKTAERLDAIEERLDAIEESLTELRLKCNEETKAASAAIASIRAAMVPGAGKIKPAAEETPYASLRDRAKVLTGAERARYICDNAQALLTEAIASTR